MRSLIPFLLALPLTLSAATFTVTTTADSGPGSLRQAILDSNATACSPVDPCRIDFAIPAPVPPSGWFTISPLSPLPVIERGPLSLDASTQRSLTGDTNPSGPEIELDGSRAGFRSGLKAFAAYYLTIFGFAINRFEGHGIFVDGTNSLTISGNYVGVDPTGTIARPNGMDGIALRNVGGSTITWNVVSGNRGNGIYVGGGMENYIGSNRIGIAASGEAAIPNGASGIDAIGSRLHIDSNTVAFNGLYGISITGDASIIANRIFGNGLLGITNGFGAGPGSQDPGIVTLTRAVEDSTTQGYYTGFPVITGNVHSTPNSDVVVSAYATPRLEPDGSATGKLYIGSVTVRTNAQGDATFEIQRSLNSEMLDLFGGYVTATAQPVYGTTSPFSRAIPITITTPTFEVFSIADSGTGSLRDAIERTNGDECTVERPCRITFNIPASRQADGIARIALDSPLPPVRGHVRFNGSSQQWWQGDTNPHGPEIEIQGGGGVQFGTEQAPVTRAYVHQIAINGSAGDGLTVHASSDSVPQISQPRIIVSEVYSGVDAAGRSASPNVGSGLRITGGDAGTTLGLTNVRVDRSLFSGNDRHGIVLSGSMHHIENNRIGTDATGTLPVPNGDDGVHVLGGTQQSLTDNTIAFNGDAGVATDPGVRAPSVLSSLHHNQSLGIDVNDDGISAADGNLEDGTIDPPVIQRAYFDAARGVTIVEGIAHPDAMPFGVPAFAGAGDRFGNAFFISNEPDPSGRGEGERYLQWTYPPIKFVEGSNGTFRFGMEGNFRGKWFTATTNRWYCYWEFGCTSRESSEFSNAVKVE